MLPTSNTTPPTTGLPKLQKLKSSEDIHANSLFVIKRGISCRMFSFFFFYEFFSLFKDGRKESAMFDKITSRILKLSEGLDLDYVDPVCSKFTFAFFFEPIKFL